MIKHRWTKAEIILFIIASIPIVVVIGGYLLVKLIEIL